MPSWKAPMSAISEATSVLQVAARNSNKNAAGAASITACCCRGSDYCETISLPALALALAAAALAAFTALLAFAHCLDYLARRHPKACRTAPLCLRFGRCGCGTLWIACTSMCSVAPLLVRPAQQACAGWRRICATPQQHTQPHASTSDIRPFCMTSHATQHDGECILVCSAPACKGL